MRSRATVLRDGVRRRRHPPLQPAGFQGGRHGVQLHRPRRHRRHRSGQDVLHPLGHALHRPPRPAPAPPRQHCGRRRDHGRPRRDAVHRHEHDVVVFIVVNGDCGGVPGVGAGRRGHVLRRLRDGGAGIHRGGLADAATRTGLEPRHGGEQAHSRVGEHDVHLARRRDHHAWVLLPLRGGDGGCVCVRVHEAAGDQGPELGGHGSALPQVRAQPHIVCYFDLSVRSSIVMIV